MNTLRLSGFGKLPARLWKRFQYWRAMRMLSRVVWHKNEAARLYATANRLIGRNVLPPMPLFDHQEIEGR